MRSVSVRLCDLEKVTLHIGYVGENNYRQINIDCKKVFDDLPEAIPSLSVKAPDETTYPATVTRDGDIVTWIVTDSDLVYEGNGEIQLTFTNDGTVAKSYIVKTRIHRSVGADGVAPTPIQNWIDQANEILEGIPGEISDEIAEQLPGEVAEQLPGAVADLIDDTATYGDTDKAWSADKLEKSFRDAKKNPEFTGGIVFGHGNVSEGSSISVTAWAQSTEYAVGDIRYIDVTPRPNPSGENMFYIYRCKTAHTSGNSFDASKWDLILMQSTEDSSASLPYKEYAEVVGNGWPNGLQSNARRLDWDGNEELAGDLTVFVGTNDEVSVSELKNALNQSNAATNSDIGKAHSPKTVVDGKVTEWQYVEVGGGGQTDIGLSVVNGEICVTYEEASA